MNAMPAVHALSAALLAALLVPVSGFAQTTPNNSDDENAINIDRVSVVGSRIKRAQIEGPAPVTVITREEMDREGFMTVGDALQTLTQNTTSSFTGDQAVNGFTPNAQVVNLRNLGPGYTLTLINGRRPAQYPYPYNRDNNVVNVNAIPSSIVERVEILSGGASAIYGSDAVAGVVNIVLRENYEGNSVRVTAGTTEHGGGDYGNVELVGGRTGNRWNALWAFQYNQHDPVFASQRKLLRDNRNGPLGNLANATLTHVALSGAGLAAAPGRNVIFPGAAACEAMGMEQWTSATRGTYCGSFTNNGARSISNKREFYSAYGYGTFDVTERTQLWASTNNYSTKAKASAGTEFYGSAIDPFITNAAGVNTALYFDPQFGDLLQLQRVFLPHEVGGNEAVATRYNEYTYDVAGGIRGSFADRFDWEANASYGLYNYEADRPRMLAQAVNNYFLGPTLGTISGFQIRELNLDRWNAPITREIYESFATRVLSVSETTASTASFNINGDLFELPAGPVGFAGLLEWSQQKIDMRSDPRIDPLRPLDEQTILNLVGSGQTYGVRDRYALGMEVRVPIVSQLSAQLAARRDKYDDISSVDAATTYNLGLEWRPASNFLLRGSYATSFRAPDMQLIYAEGAASFSAILDEYACRAGVGPGEEDGPRTRAQCNVGGDRTIYQAQTVIAGNPELKEEEGKSWVAGFVWDIIDGMSITADWYRIKLEGAARQLSSATLLQREADCRIGSTVGNRVMPTPAECAQVLSLITRTEAPGTTDHLRIQRLNNAYINTAEQDTTGIDSNWRWRWNTDRAGSFNFNVAYSLVLTNKYRQTTRPDDQLIDYRDENRERSRMRGSVAWRYHDWTTTLFGTRYGSTFSAAGEAGENDAGGRYGHRLAPFMLYNLSIGRKFGPNIDGMIQVANLFDRQYRKDNSRTGYPFYDIYNGSNPIGRQFYVSVAYKF